MPKPRYHLALIPLAIAGILITTAVPIELGADAGWSSTFGLGDFLQNLLLYVPLGVALWRTPLWKVGLTAAALSLVIEISQLWGVERFASGYDVLSNTLGALGAAICCRLLAQRGVQRDRLRVTPARLTVASLTALGIFASWALPSQPATLTGWDPSYPILLGNERTPDRPWRGTIDWLSVFPSGSSRARLIRGPGAEGEGFSLYTTVTLDGGPARELPPEAATVLMRRLSTTQGFTVAARIRTDDLSQEGPARIITFSGDTLHRNFDLGQERDRLVFRVRTPISGENGERARVMSLPILQAGRSFTVVATYDGMIARIFVDGVLVGRSNIAAAGCRVGALCGWAVPSAWSIVGGVAALLALSLVPLARRGPTIMIALLAGLVPMGLVYVLPHYGLLAGTHGWFPLLSLFGAGTVGVAKRE